MSSATANHGKRVLLTGGTRGIGRSTAMQLVQRGFQVVVTIRNPKKAEEMLLEVDPASRHLLSYAVLRLENVEAVENDLPAILALHQTQPFDIVIANAGTMFPLATSAAVEPTFMVNYLGHSMLANELVRIRPPGHRMHFVGVSSIMIKYCFWPLMVLPATEAEMWATFGPRSGKNSSGFAEYAFSKAALGFLLQGLAKQPNVSTSLVNPGNSATEISVNMPGWQKMLLGFFFRHTLIPVEEAAGRVAAAVLSPIGPVTDRWYDGGMEVPLPQYLLDEKIRMTLAEFTKSILAQNSIDRR